MQITKLKQKYFFSTKKTYIHSENCNKDFKVALLESSDSHLDFYEHPTSSKSVGSAPILHLSPLLSKYILQSS